MIHIMPHSGGTGNNNNSWWTQSVDAYSAMNCISGSNTMEVI